MTRQELESRRDAFERAKRRWLLPRCVALTVPLVLLPMGIGVVLREYDAPEWAAITAACVGIAGAPLWAWCCDLMLVRLRRVHGMACPHCQETLVNPDGKLTLSGTDCRGCGAALVVDAV